MNMNINNDIINIGSFEITVDAFLYLISGLLLYIILILNYGITWEYFGMLLVYLIGSYKVNCMIVGKCNYYAKSVAIMSVIATGLIILTLPNNKSKKNINMETKIEKVFY